MREKVIIMMSTYNGEKFLCEQIDSILAQENVEPIIIIRDDGSTDNSLKILRQYKQLYPHQIILIEGENMGWRKSFFTLICYAYNNFNKYVYFAFADQDDIWLPQKMISAITLLRDYKSEVALYCSSLYSYRNGITERIIRRDVKPSCKNCIVRNYATGCTIVFTRSLLLLLGERLPGISVPHDHWCYMVAKLCGKVLVDPTPYILYRQHSQNQIGNKTSIFDIWKRRITNFWGVESYKFRENICRELYSLYRDDMLPEGLDAILKIMNYKKSISNRIKLFVDNGYTLNNPINDSFFKLKVLLGIV